VISSLKFHFERGGGLLSVGYSVLCGGGVNIVFCQCQLGAVVLGSQCRWGKGYESFPSFFVIISWVL
jgi:hypothetical protein